MSTQTITPDVLAVLKRSTIVDKLLILPPGQLERSLYNAVNKVLENAGALWSRKQKGHLFLNDPREVLGLALETGRIENLVDEAKAEKQLYQAFFTPADLAKRVVELADVAGRSVLEPSAGEGALVQECLNAGCESLTAVELNAETCVKLRQVNDGDRGQCKPFIYEADFLSLKLRKGDFDRIVMNPPFTRNQDVRHVERALTFLAPGGVLVAIMSPNTARPGFQDLLTRYDYDIEEVPAGTFKESGTNIAAVILTIRK